MKQTKIQILSSLSLTWLSLCLLIGTPALAQVATGTATTASSTASATSTTASSTVHQTPTVERRSDARTDRRAALATIRQERVINLAANISNRMDAATERLFNIVARIETRIEKLDQAGYSTTAAKEKLRDASSTLAEAKTTLASIDTLVYSATTSEKPKTDWQPVRDSYLDTGKLIRQAQAELRESLSLLKTAISKGPTGTDDPEEDMASQTNATSTEEVIDVI